MELTEEQIHELYKFTKKHYVEHYDVQTELVDHLANDIEQVWVEYPNLSFKEARDKSFKKFGVFGFMEVVESRQKAMTKRYWKILLRFVKDWFTLPKLILTLVVFVLFFFILKLKEAPFILIFFLFVLAIFEIVSGLIVRYKVKKRKKLRQKIYLLEEMIHKTKNGFVIIIILNFSNLLMGLKIDFQSLSIYWVIFFGLFFTLLMICFYVTEFVIPQKADELLQETYPEYKIS